MTGAPPAGRGAPNDPTAATETHRLAVAFARVLRSSGLAVLPGSTTDYARALAAVGLGRRAGVYWAGRATLLQRPEDVTAYDAAFDAFWLGRAAPPAATGEEDVSQDETSDPADRDGELGTDPPDQEGGPPDVVLRYSPNEILRHKDFAVCTPAELAETHRLMAAMRLGGAVRRTRRYRPARRGPRPDLRRTMRHALRTGGEPLRRHWRAPVERPRRVVLLCDVSGSMAPYARALLRFCHVSVAGRRRVEAFTVGTRLTRVTRALSRPDPDAALAAAAESVADWSGGTRLGEALADFNHRWGVPGLARGAVVVILSDGWDRGDPELLGAEMARLARVARRVVWANPLKASPGYAPLVRGMAAALPHIDDFVEGHSLASIEALAELVAVAPGRSGAVGHTDLGERRSGHPDGRRRGRLVT